MNKMGPLSLRRSFQGCENLVGNLQRCLLTNCHVPGRTAVAHDLLHMLASLAIGNCLMPK